MSDFMEAEDWCALARNSSHDKRVPHSSLEAEVACPVGELSAEDLIHSLLNEPHPGLVATPKRRRAR